MPHMYILMCADGSTYVGSTWDLERRLAEHQLGLGAEYTQKRLPVRLIYAEECDRIDDAYRRGKQIQNWSRVKRLALANGDVDALERASRKKPKHRSQARASGDVSRET